MSQYKLKSGSILVNPTNLQQGSVQDQLEDRSSYLRSDEPITWTGSELQFTQDIVIEIVHSANGTVTEHIVQLADSPIQLADLESAWVEIDRSAATENLTVSLSGTLPVPAHSAQDKDVIILFRRVDAGGAGYLHIPFHKQVLEPGQTVRLGASGSGSGAGDGLAGDYKRRLVLSPFDYVTPNIFETDKVTKIASGTGEYDPAKKAFLMNIGQNMVSTQNLDPEFLATGTDVATLELYLNWLEGFVDLAATYEVSRDGGVNWQPITMSRVGLSETFRGYLNVVTEGANNDLEGYSVANADTNLALNATTTQQRAGSFVATNSEIAKTVEVYLNKTGSPTGNYKVQVVKDSAGSPSTSVLDVISESDLLPIASLSAGNNTVIVDISDIGLVAGTYWIVFVTDATYKGVFSAGVTQLAVRADTSAPTGGASAQYNGTAWSATASTSTCFQFKGRVLDVRVRVTAGTNGVYLRGYGLYYGVVQGVTTQNVRKYHKTSFAGVAGVVTVNLPFIPDPYLLTVYDVYRGQVYVADSEIFRIDGSSVTFISDLFNFIGETVVLVFRQNDVPAAQDTSDSNATLIQANTNRIDDNDLLETNYATNAQFRGFQRQVPATLTTKSDAAYGPDRWKLLTSHTTNVQSARVVDSPSNSPSKNAVQVRQADATARQFGMVQYLDSDRVWELRGRRVTYGFWVKATAANIPNIRASIVEWNGTENSLTSDPVATWAATPTLAANFSHASSVSDLAMTGNWVYFEVSTTLSGSFNNLALMIWTPATAAQNSDLYVTQVQLVSGSKARQFTRIALKPAEDITEMERFYQKSYNFDTAPGAVGVQNGAIQVEEKGAAGTSGLQIHFRSRLFKDPAVVGYSDVTGASGVFNRATIDTAIGSIQNTGQNGFIITGGAGASTFSRVHYTAEAEL